MTEGHWPFNRSECACQEPCCSSSSEYCSSFLPQPMPPGRAMSSSARFTAAAETRAPHFETTTSSSSTRVPAGSTWRAGRCSTPRPLERPGRRPPPPRPSPPAAPPCPIAPGRSYLVQLASNADVGAPLPTPDATGTSNLGAASGKIALVPGMAALTCGPSAGSCSGLVEDLVGYGDASDFEGSGSAAALSNTTAAVRADGGCADTNDNTADFAAATPAPRNSASAAHLCAGLPSSGPNGSVNVALDVASVLTVSLDRPSLSFGTFTSGDRPAPLPERVTVSSNNPSGYSLAVGRTAFVPTDLPLALSATAPAGGTLGGGLSGGALAPIPIAPATGLTVGTRSAPSAA